MISAALTFSSGQTRWARRWRALNTPRGVFWTRAASAVLMLVLGVLVLVFAFGSRDQQVIGAAALLIASFHAATAVGQWPDLEAAEGSADREPPS